MIYQRTREFCRLFDFDPNEGRAEDGKWVGSGGAESIRKEAPSPKQKPLSPKERTRKAQILNESHAAPPDQEYYHGTSATNVESILKRGILPTDKTLGVPAAFVGASSAIAHAYGAGSAADNDSDKVAIVVVKGSSGLTNFRGETNVGMKVGEGIKPEDIDRIEIYRAGSAKDEKPLSVIYP